MSTIKVQKSVVYAVIITFVITFALTYFIFAYYPNMQKDSSVNEYKKVLFDSVSCQYACPLTNQTINNRTQLLPSQECAKECTAPARAMQNSTKLTNADLANDNLISDIESAVNDCKMEALNQTTLSINNQQFFPCVVSKLEALKTKYSYLN